MMIDEREMSVPKEPGRWWRRARRAVLLYVVVPYLAVVVIFAVFQRRLMYRPTVADNLRIAAIDRDGGSGTDVELKTADGSTLRGWLLYGGNRDSEGGGEAPLLIYFPGNSLNRQERINDLREVAARGFDVLIFDYRGFGDSTGSPTEATLSADALLIWNYARDELGYDERRIVVFGESIGGAVALSLWSDENANPPQPAALILSSTFASMPQTVAWHYPWFPFQYLLLDRWPSIERIARVDVPVIVFHGTDDEFVPVAHGRALAEASERARFVEIPGGTHNEIPMMRLREELKAIIAGLPAGESRAGVE